MRKLLAAALLCSHAPVALVTAQEVQAPERYAAAKAVIERAIENGETPSIAVAVLDDGKIVWAEGFGLADVEARTKATPDTIYRLASISKPFTATAIMQLVERGLVDLDRPVNEYLATDAQLRAYRGTADQITVRRLLNHTAGLPTHWNFFYEGETPPSRDESIRQFGFAAFEPGTRTNYSNFAFGVLDHVVARLGETSYRDWLVRELCDPIGMKHTDVGIRPGAEDHAAIGYRKTDGAWQKVRNYGFDHDGASAVRSSVNDLMRFARLQINRGQVDGTHVLSEESALAMRQKTAEAAGSSFGIGWSAAKLRGLDALQHSGGMPGVSTNLVVLPAAGVAVAVLTNSSNRKPTNRVLDAILDARLDPADSGWRAAVGTADSTRILGRFRGQMAHSAGAIPVDLSLGLLDGLRIGNEAVEFERVDGHVRLECSYPLPTGHGSPVAADLRFDLRLEDETAIRGVCYATVDGVCRLPFWVELRRQAKKPKNALRVISYNVLVGFQDSSIGRFLPGCQRQARISAWLAAQRPDVVAFQEMNGFDEERLKELARAWGHEHVALLKEDGYPVALTSNEKIQVIARHRQNLHHGLLHARTHDVDFIVVHFAPMPGVPRKVLEVAAALKCYRLATSVDHDAIVLGDFNSLAPHDVDRFSAAATERYRKWQYLMHDGKPAEIAMGPLLSAGAIDVVHDQRALPDELPLPRIDFILSSPDLAAECMGARWLADPAMLRLSDHPAVVADFRRR